MPCQLIVGFANGVTRILLSRGRNPRTYSAGAKAGDPQWDVKTLGTLLQPAAVLLVKNYSVVRRHRSIVVRWCGVNNVTLTSFIDNTNLIIFYWGHLLVGSSAGVAFRRQKIIGDQSSAHSGQNSEVEFKCKSWIDRNLHNKDSCYESMD